ncbi:MAG: hypothetical protein E7356_01480 [Clostridiales bacterium]|nr:hypothetical protein [Clostridiales bacterium]
MKKALKFLSLAFVAIFAGTLLTACVPSNIEKATEKMKEAGYTVYDYDKGEDAEGFVGGIVATKDLLKDRLVALLFDSKADAKDFYEDMTDSEKNSEDNPFQVSGKWVYSGTEDAIDAFKG